MSRKLVLIGSPVLTFLAGVAMAVWGNPYLALFLLLAGITLGITSWLAVREAQNHPTTFKNDGKACK